MRTYSAKGPEVTHDWYVVDAEGQTLGRLASEVASLLRGKHKTLFTPHVDVGDHVIVINASKVKLTGKKLIHKIHYRHSQYPGGLKALTYRAFLERSPEKAVEKAVRGMLPHNRLGRQMARKLHVYAGDAHPHQAQRPQLKPESARQVAAAGD